jgi:vancomycin resistance protein YoaR
MRSLGERVGVESSRETWPAEGEGSASTAVRDGHRPRWEQTLLDRVELDRLTQPTLRNPLFSAGAAALLIIVISLIGRLTVRGEVLPGVHAGDVALGGLSREEAAIQLSNNAQTLLSSRPTLSYGGKTWTPTMAELGVTVDVAASVEQAMDYGRSYQLIDGLFRPFHLSPIGGEVHLRTDIDLDRLDEVLRSYAQEVGIAPTDPGITLDNGAATITAGANGHRFDTVAVATTLGHHLESNGGLAIELAAMSTDVDIDDADLARLQPIVDQVFASPLQFTDGDRSWSVAPADLAPLVHIVKKDGNPELALDQDSVRALAGKLASEIDGAPVEPAMADNDGIKRLVHAATGKQVRTDDLVAAINQTFSSGGHNVSVPFDATEPSQTTDEFLASLGVTDLIATGESDFAGSEPGRATNVRVGADLVDNVLVEPHGTFSFNFSIGDINVTPGWVPAGASEGGIPGTALGGGVCQVTTTIFRAALYGGLPISEWWPHAYRNVYYENGGWSPGFDASIQQPDDDPWAGTDFKFENPTDGWLLITSSITDGTKLTIEIHGTATGYEVEIDDPIVQDVVSAEGYSPVESVDPNLPEGTQEIVQPARDGMTVIVGRHVYDADGNSVFDDQFESYYVPQGPSYRVSEDLAGTTGA